MLKLTTTFLTASIILCGVISASAQTPFIYDSGHGDLRVLFDESTRSFTPVIRMDGGTDYRANEVVVEVNTKRTVSSTGFQNLLGITPGSTIYIAGASWAQPDLGFSTENLNPADWNQTFFDPSWGMDVTFPILDIQLTDWSGPQGSQIGLYRTNMLNAMSEGIASSYNPSFTTSGDNSFRVAVQDHVHYAFAFTHAGTYELEFTFSGLYQNEDLITATERFTFHVIPEPSLVILTGLGAGALFLLRKRRSANP